MKILYLYDAIARLGGVERIWVDKMNCLADQYNEQVYLITTCQGKHSLAYQLSDKIKHIDINVRFHTKYQYSMPKRLWMGWQMDRQLIKRLNEIVNEINPNIIIATTYYKADVICNLKCYAKKIIESHVARIFTGINDGVKRSFISEMYLRWVYRKYFNTIENKSDAIVTLTNGDAKDWNTKKISVIPNIVNIKNTAYSQLTNKTAIFAGRFTYQKGLDRMLKAWKLVVNKRSDWKLKLVGEGEQKEQFIRQCKELGIENNVIFAEATKDIVKEYIDSSMFLFTSRFEGFGLVLVEAMQCGVPCVSFDCPYGPSDIIDDGINGYLIENGNVEKFADAVLILIENDDLRMQMGKAAIEKSRQYLPENIMPQWIKLYNSLTDDK